MAAERPSSLVCMDSSKTLRVLRTEELEEVMMEEEEEEEEEDEEELEIDCIRGEAVLLSNAWLKLRAALLDSWQPLGTSFG